MISICPSSRSRRALKTARWRGSTKSSSVSWKAISLAAFSAPGAQSVASRARSASTSSGSRSGSQSAMFGSSPGQPSGLPRNARNCSAQDATYPHGKALTGTAGTGGDHRSLRDLLPMAQGALAALAPRGAWQCHARSGRAWVPLARSRALGTQALPELRPGRRGAACFIPVRPRPSPPSPFRFFIVSKRSRLSPASSWSSALRRG